MERESSREKDPQLFVYCEDCQSLILTQKVERALGDQIAAAHKNSPKTRNHQVNLVEKRPG